MLRNNCELGCPVMFVELTHVGFAWGPRLQWPTVFELEEQVFKLEGVTYYVDSKSVGSMDFLGGKERIRILINSNSLSTGWFES